MNKFTRSLFIATQYVIPKQAVSKLFGILASANMGDFTTWIIKKFIKKNNIDMSIVADPDLSHYKTFNDFFARAINPESRPIAPDEDAVASPVDGTVSQLGAVTLGRIIQAKGMDYSLRTLLGGDQEISAPFKDGSFVTIYLSPRDYHRVHMPYSGRLLKTVFIPGTLYSVNPVVVSHVDELFTKNERLVCIFETNHGRMAVVFVGATIVGSIETVWGGIEAPTKNSKREVKVTSYEDQNLIYQKGDEIGRFLFGSTVICCFEKGKIEFDSTLMPENTTLMGQQIARMIKK